MSQTDAQFKLRLPHDLLNQVKADALANNRSVNAEIVKRLGEHDTPLRDWLAGQVIVGIGTWIPDHRVENLLSDAALSGRAKFAYAQADAMLKAREGN